VLETIKEHFQTKAKPLVGLDISATSVKLLELSHNGQRYCVEGFAVVPLPPDAVVDKLIKDQEAVTEAIATALRKSRSQAKFAAVAVADSLVISKRIPMDASLSDDEIETQLALEADRYIPYPLEEVSLDFAVGELLPDDPQSAEVLLVASRRDNVDVRVDMLADAGLTARVVDVESHAMERAALLLKEQFPNQGVDQSIAIVDIGSVLTNLTVIHNLNTIFTREEVFGGEQLTREIQRHYGLSYAEAGLAKKQGNLPDDYEPELLQPFRELAVLQVRRALQFFFSATDFSQVDYIILSGGSAALPGLVELIQEQIGVSTAIANPFTDMAVGKHVSTEALTRDTAALMICCGLAMRGVDQSGY